MMKPNQTYFLIDDEQSDFAKSRIIVAMHKFSQNILYLIWLATL